MPSITANLKKVGSELSDVRLNKSGTVGTEPIARKAADGSFEKGVEVKFGKAGSMFVPTDKIKRYVRRAGDAAKTVGQLGYTIATEPFTNRLLKENNALADKEIKQKADNQQEARLSQRYPMITKKK